jgi:hypothetical protein
MLRVTRPDLRNPDRFLIDLNESMMYRIEDGLIETIRTLYRSAEEHLPCNLREDTGCAVRGKWLVDQYGTLEAAASYGYYLTDCSEDLKYIYGELNQIMDLLYQARHLRTNKQKRDPYEEDHALKRLAALKIEASNQERVSTPITQEIPVVEEPKPAEEPKLAQQPKPKTTPEPEPKPKTTPKPAK